MNQTPKPNECDKAFFGLMHDLQRSIYKMEKKRNFDLNKLTESLMLVLGYLVNGLTKGAKEIFTQSFTYPLLNGRTFELSVRISPVPEGKKEETNA